MGLVLDLNFLLYIFNLGKRRVSAENTSNITVQTPTEQYLGFITSLWSDDWVL